MTAATRVAPPPPTSGLHPDHADSLDGRLPRAMLGSLCALVAIGPWIPAAVLPLMLLVAALWVADCLLQQRLPRSGLLLALALIPLAQAISLSASIDLRAGIGVVVSTSLGWCCAAAVVRCATRVGIDVVVFAMIASAAVVSVASLTTLGALTSRVGGAVVDGRLQGPFAQPNELGSYMAMLIPLILVAAVQWRGRRRSGLLLVMIPVGAVLVLSLSRGAWLGTLTALVVLLVVVPRLRAPLTVLSGVGLASLLLIHVANLPGPVGVVADRVDSILQPSASAQDFRPEIWDFAGELVVRHPLLGVGPGGFPAAVATGESPLSLYVPQHPHNLILTMLAEGGVLALAAWTIPAAVMVMLIGRYRRSMDLTWATNATTIAPAAALAGMAAHGLVDMPWRNPGLLATLWMLLGLLAASPLGPRVDLGRHLSTSVASITQALTPTNGSPSLTPWRTPMTADHSESIDSSDDDGLGDGTPKAPSQWRLIARLAAAASAVLVLVVVVWPSHQEATSVVGLRSATVEEGQVPISADELRLIVQQYAVAIAADTTVDDAVEESGAGDGASATAEVDPETATMRIVARADDAPKATALAQRLTAIAEQRAEDDSSLELVVLAAASEAHTTTTPPKLLYLGLGLVVIALLSTGVALARRET